MRFRYHQPIPNFYNIEINVPQTTKGDYTIKILNLNTYRLREARKAYYQLCESYHDDEKVKTFFLQPDENNQLQPHADIVKYFFG